MATRNVRWNDEWVEIAGGGSGGGSQWPTIDNYEDALAGPYGAGDDLTTYYTHTTGPESFTRQAVGIEGTYAAEIEPTSWHNYISPADSGLPYYPQDGDVVSGLMYAETPDGSQNNPQPFYGWYGTMSNSATNGYAVMPANLSDDYALELRRYDEDSSNQLATGSVSLDIATWYDYEVELSGDTFTAHVYDVDQSTGERLTPDTPIETISATDSTHAPARGLLLGNRGEAGTGSVARVDDVRKVGEV